MKQPPSQEYMNAFVDGELAAGERDEALARLESDAEFKRAVCELRMMKELVRGAYPETQPARRSAILYCPPAWRQALVAGLLLCLGLAGGWFAHDLSAPAKLDSLVGLPDGYTPVALASAVDPDRVVLHLDSGDPARLDASLDLAERLLARRGADVRIEIVVNSNGLNLLRQDISPHRARIEDLARRHANLAFLACGQAMARLQREGVDVVLVPEAGVATSAINEIITRMGQGWVYVKV